MSTMMSAGNATNVIECALIRYINIKYIIIIIIGVFFNINVCYKRKMNKCVYLFIYLSFETWCSQTMFTNNKHDLEFTVIDAKKNGSVRNLTISGRTSPGWQVLEGRSHWCTRCSCTNPGRRSLAALTARAPARKHAHTKRNYSHILYCASAKCQ